MSDAKWWLVSYDVRDSNRLRKVAKKLEGYGERLQYSVFRCRLEARLSGPGKGRQSNVWAWGAGFGGHVSNGN